METYEALCDYNGFPFREEIQWVRVGPFWGSSGDERCLTPLCVLSPSALCGPKLAVNIFFTSRMWTLSTVARAAAISVLEISATLAAGMRPARIGRRGPHHLYP